MVTKLTNYHLLSRERNQISRKANALKNPGIYTYVVDKLRSGWSPEQIAGRLRKHNHGKTVICPETIYRYIYSQEGRRENLREYLVRAHKKRYPKHYRKSYRRGIPIKLILASDRGWAIPENNLAIGKRMWWRERVILGAYKLFWKEKLDIIEPGLYQTLTLNTGLKLKKECYQNSLNKLLKV